MLYIYRYRCITPVLVGVYTHMNVSVYTSAMVGVYTPPTIGVIYRLEKVFSSKLKGCKGSAKRG